MGTRGMLDRQSDLLKTQQQLSTGQRVLKPSDDPLATVQANGYQQAADVIAQYKANVDAAKATLSLGEAAMGEAGNVLQDIRERVVQAGDPSLSDSDRKSIALELRERYNELLAIANRKDGQGRALFAGYAEDVTPFADNGSTITYSGDGGVRSLDVSASRSIAVSASGAAVFEGLAQGNGRFTTANAATNTGDGSVDVGQVSNLALLTGHAYSIDFIVIGTTTTYSITDATLGVTISSGNGFASGAAIDVDGQQVQVKGAPKNGDKFTIAPAGVQDLFTPIKQAISALETPLTTPAARGQFDTLRGRAMAGIDSGADRLLSARAGFGASLKELDSLTDAHAAASEQYASDISRLTSLDYAQAVSDFTREQQALEAAQKAFQGTTQLSLFKLL
jgi:flagellar hook-associated protein 3 FlgL